MDRSKKALKNVTSGLINKVGIMFLTFVNKTIFIRLLGAEYNGINTLYSNILLVLALAELGLGNVLIYYLYSALKYDDHEKICALTQEFKKIYNIIILFILGMGLAIVPFLKYLVKSDLDGTDLVIYYLLYLINSVASYLVAYRVMVIKADQKIYVINNVDTIVTILFYIIQIICLFIFKNFLVYLIIQVSHTIGSNLIMDYVTVRRYPYLKQKVKNTKDKIDFKEIFNNVKAAFISKISDTLVDQTDNIIISVMFGTVLVGYYNNYVMLIVYIQLIAMMIQNGVVAGVGNLVAEKDNAKLYSVMKCSCFFYSIFGIFCVACYASVIQDFIPIWLGKEYLMGVDLVVCILVVFYLRMIMATNWIYRSAFGIFKEVQYVNVITAVLNIVFSVLLGKIMGIGGVVIATALARLFTSFWYEAKVIYKKIGVPLREFFKMQLKSLFTLLLVVGSTYYINDMIRYEGVIVIVLKLLVCIVFTAVYVLIIYGKSEEAKVIVGRLRGIMRK